MQEGFDKSTNVKYNSFVNKNDKYPYQYLNQLLNIENELKIKAFDDLRSFFSEVKFVNKFIEEVYQKEKDEIFLLFENQTNNFVDNKKNRKNSIFKSNILSSNFDSDMIINFVFIMGYIVSLLYLLIPYYNPILLSICLFCKILTCIIVLISYRLKKSEKYKSHTKLFHYLDHLLIFISSFNLNLKIVLLAVIFTTEEKDNSEELIRVIIYQFVSTNMYLIVKLEANIKITLFYFAKDFLCILIAQIYSKREHYYVLDGVTSFATYVIFYIFRKIWDLKLRSHFASKLKFKDFFSYVNDLINGLKGYHFNIYDYNCISYNEKFKEFVKLNHDQKNFFDKLILDNVAKIKNQSQIKNEDQKKYDQSGTQLKKDDKNKYENKELCEYVNDELLIEQILIDLKKEFKLYSLFNNKSNLNTLQMIHSNEKLLEELNLNLFLHNLILYNINSKNLNGSSDKNEGSVKDNENCFDNDTEDNCDQNEKCLFEILSERLNAKKDKKRFTIDIIKFDNFKNDCYDQNVESLGVYEVKKNKAFLEKIIIFFSNYEKKESNKNFKHQSISNIENNKIRFPIKLNQDLSENKILKEPNFEDSKDLLKLNNNGIEKENILIHPKKTVSKKNSLASIKIESKKYLKSFSSEKADIGKSLIDKKLDKKENTNKKDKFFEIFLRKVEFTNGKIIYNLIFYDMTELIEAKNTLLREHFHKTRLFAKIAHEFKTPLNSILSILYKISEEIRIDSFEEDAFDGRFIANNNFNNSENKKNVKNSIDKECLNIPEKSKTFDEINVKSNLSSTDYQKRSFKNINDIDIKRNGDNKAFLSANIKSEIFLAYDLINSINFLVSDIITLSNINNLNQLNVRNDSLNLKEILSSSSKVLQTLIFLSKTKQKMIKTETIIDSSITFDLEFQNYIKSDESKIKQILFNFITNAVKFTNRGKIIIEAKMYNNLSSNDPIVINWNKDIFDLEHKSKNLCDINKTTSNNQNNEYNSSLKNKSYFCISVIDTGIGINIEDQKNIFNSNFEDDYKNNKNIKDIFKIKGFGLMICKYLAKLMKINIGFSSQENKGSRFFIIIPIDDIREPVFSSRITIDDKFPFIGIDKNLTEYLFQNKSVNNSENNLTNKDKNDFYSNNKNKSSKFNKSDPDNNKTFSNLKKMNSIWNVEINNKKFSTEINKLTFIHGNEISFNFINNFPANDKNEQNQNNLFDNESNSSVERINVIIFNKNK